MHDGVFVAKVEDSAAPPATAALASRDPRRCFGSDPFLKMSAGAEDQQEEEPRHVGCCKFLQHEPGVELATHHQASSPHRSNSVSVDLFG